LSKIIELFGKSRHAAANWRDIVAGQICPFLNRRCYKVRKSQSEISIGTCTVTHGADETPLIICPTRLIEGRQIFADSLPLLTQHEIGNELHIVSEVSIPGGSVDYFLVSVKDAKVRDFAGIELQTLDTTGTVWPERQRLVRALGIPTTDNDHESDKTHGVNWKMTAKTILVQLHHKIETFEHVNKKLVLVVQDHLLNYMTREFNFGHLNPNAPIGDSMHFHSYKLEAQPDKTYRLRFDKRLSTDAAGIATAMGLQAVAKVELEVIIRALQAKISPATRFAIV
jgi:hypothetical protein